MCRYGFTEAEVRCLFICPCGPSARFKTRVCLFLGSRQPAAQRKGVRWAVFAGDPQTLVQVQGAIAYADERLGSVLELYQAVKYLGKKSERVSADVLAYALQRLGANVACRSAAAGAAAPARAKAVVPCLVDALVDAGWLLQPGAETVLWALVQDRAAAAANAVIARTPQSRTAGGL